MRIEYARICVRKKNKVEIEKLRFNFIIIIINISSLSLSLSPTIYISIFIIFDWFFNSWRYAVIFFFVEIKIKKIISFLN
jgi:hypothetical protein